MTGPVLGAIVLLGLLSLLNLLLTYGVVRRLREHEQRLGSTGAGGEPVPQLAPGSRLPEFTAVATDGREITAGSLGTGVAFLGVFATKCRPCHEQLPRFLEAVSALDRDRVLVVINDDGDDREALAALVSRAEAVARVVVAPTPNPLAAAIGVDTFPTMLMLDGGRVIASAFDVARLPVPAAG